MLVIETGATNQGPPFHDAKTIRLSHMRMMHQVDSREKNILKHNKETENKRRAENLPFQVNRSIYSFTKPKNARSFAVENNAKYENASVYVIKMPVHYAVHSYRFSGMIRWGSIVGKLWVEVDVRYWS